MHLTDAECLALAQHPAHVVKALVEVVATIPDLEQIRLAVTMHPQAAALANSWRHRYKELDARAHSNAGLAPVGLSADSPTAVGP